MGPLRFLAIPLPLACAIAATAAAPVEGLVAPYRQAQVSAPVSSFIVDLTVQEGEPEGRAAPGAAVRPA